MLLKFRRPHDAVALIIKRNRNTNLHTKYLFSQHSNTLLDSTAAVDLHHHHHRHNLFIINTINRHQKEKEEERKNDNS